MRNALVPAVLGLLAVTPLSAATCDVLPCPLTSHDAAAFLTAAAGARPWIEVQRIGRSAGGRELLAAHLERDPAASSWTLLLIGQLHGDEVAGGTALVQLVHGIAADPTRLPPDVDLWVVPIANPDGAAAGTRRNAAGADLNRDHLVLAQPETLALHRLARAIVPDVVIDCHEFARDSADYTARGWHEWPLIMMDTANLPWLPTAVYGTGLAWVDAARAPMLAAGFE